MIVRVMARSRLSRTFAEDVDAKSGSAQTSFLSSDVQYEAKDELVATNGMKVIARSGR